MPKPKTRKPRVADSIRRGLEQAVAHARGLTVPGVRVSTVYPVEVKAIRQALGLTQGEFAARFGLNVDTLRAWEQRKRRSSPTSVAKKAK